MKLKFYIINLIFAICFAGIVKAQTTGLNIYQPNFATQQAGWATNGNASFGTINSASAIILTPSTGTQIGTAFWKQQISLSNNASFSTFFTFQIDQNTSRADGITFILQQQSATATASTGEGLGYGGFTGANMAIEFDTYQNGYDPDNNHIALDLNGSVNHSSNGGLVKSINTSTLDLADANLKYVWIDYNGSTHLLEVRISYSNSRPSKATLSTTSYNLSSIFTNKSVYMGFGAATGGAMERHSITSFYAINQYQPITTSTNTYAQDPLGISMTSPASTVAGNGTSKLPITVTLTDAGGSPLANQPVTLSIVSGNGTLSTVSGTTNASGQLVVNLSGTTASTVTIKSTAGYGGVNTNGSYSITGTLPLVVTGFSASKQNEEVVLNWNILSVDNGKNIEVLRSTDGVNFESIGVLEVNNQASLLGAHSFVDKTPNQGMNYYKLQMNNLDGLISFSSTEMVNISNANGQALKILGNPVSSTLRLTGFDNNGGVAVIYNLSGKIMSETRISSGSNVVEIPCNNFPSGEYFVKVYQNASSNTLTFLKF
jgi:hypothetical protein